MERLYQYNKIALDFDGTLIDGGYQSILLQRFVKENPNKQFYILTFRSPMECQNLAQELENSYHLLTIQNFEQIIPCPERIIFDYNQDSIQRRISGLPSPTTQKVDNLFPGEIKFMNWKPYVCKKLGIRVLVDDMAKLVEDGCKTLGIKFIDTHSLFEEQLVVNESIHNGTFFLPTSVLEFYDEPNGAGDDGYTTSELKDEVIKDGGFTGVVEVGFSNEMDDGKVYVFNGNHRLEVARLLNINEMECMNARWSDDAVPLTHEQIKLLGGRFF